MSERFSLSLAFLKKPRQGVRHRICLSFTIIDTKMVLKKLLCPANLPEVPTFGIYELMNNVVVSEDKDLVFADLQVVAPSF